MDSKNSPENPVAGLSDLKSNCDESLDTNSTLTLPVYGTRKSSRRLLQQLNQNQTETQLITSCNSDCAVTSNGSTCLVVSTETGDQSDVNSTSQSDISSSLNVNKVVNTSGHYANTNSNSTVQSSTNAHQTNSVNSSGQSSITAQTTSTAKHQRKWEMWQADDTRWFFEALNEHGKDFNSIHQYMCGKLKKKGTPEYLMKNKEQIRCYFNRQWNKVSGLLDQNNDALKNVDKTAQQLYAMINYGEIWKKFNFRIDFKFDSKMKTHLNDMIFTGHTFMKIGKGKNFKFKTPTCKALKRLNNLNNYDPIAQHLPKDVTIELIPASNYAWLRVQSVAQNPILHVKCTPQKRLRTLIEFLEDRWNKTIRRNYLCELHTGQSLNLNSKDSQAGDSKQNDDKLRLKPHSALTKSMNTIRLLRHQTHNNFSQTDLSLNAYLSKANSWPENKRKRNLNQMSSHGCHKKVNREEALSNKTDANKKSDNQTTSEQQANVSTGLSPDSTDKSNISPIIETVRSLNVLNNLVSSSCEDGAQNQNVMNKSVHASNTEQVGFLNKQNVEESSLPPPNVTIGEWLKSKLDGKGKPTDNTINAHVDTGHAVKGAITTPNNVQNEEQLCRVIDVNVIKNGWTSDQTDELTIGELCLAFKCKGKLTFQYDWEASEPIQTKSVLNKLIATATIALEYMNKKQQQAQQNVSNLTNKNAQLLNSSQTSGANSAANVMGSTSTSTGSRKTKKLKNSDACKSTIGPEVGTANLEEKQDKSVVENKNVNNNTQQSGQFLMPMSPAPRASTVSKQPTKNRIVDDALLQEAKEQLGGKFTTRRLSRKPAIVKPQQFHLSLNANQFLGTNLRQLLAGKNIGNISNKTYVSASTDSPAIISMIAAAASGQNSASSAQFKFTNQNGNSKNQSMPSSANRNRGVAWEAEQQPMQINQAKSVPETNVNESMPIIASTSNYIHPGTNVCNAFANTGTPDEVIAKDRLSMKSNQSINQIGMIDEIQTPMEQIQSQVEPQVEPQVQMEHSIPQTNLQPKPPSPLSLSCLLDMSLGETGPLFNDSTDKFFFNNLMPNNNAMAPKSSANIPTKVSPEENVASTSGSKLTSFQMHFDQFEQRNAHTDAYNSLAHVPTLSDGSKSTDHNHMHLNSAPLSDHPSWLTNVTHDLSLTNLFDCAMDQSASDKHSSHKTISDFNLLTASNQSVDLQSTDSMSMTALINENSLDLMSKFVDLADKISE